MLFDCSMCAQCSIRRLFFRIIRLTTIVYCEFNQREYDEYSVSLKLAAATLFDLSLYEFCTACNKNSLPIGHTSYRFVANHKPANQRNINGM